MACAGPNGWSSGLDRSWSERSCRARSSSAGQQACLFRTSAGERRIEHVFDSPSFIHLNVRSYFSIKDGACSPEDLARRAAELEMPAVAMTDRDGLYGAARFAAACARYC